MNKIKTYSKSSEEELANQKSFYDLYKNSPIIEDETLNNLGLFMNRKNLSRIIFMHDMYKRILDVNGIVIEFGVRWGQNLSLFQNFRAIYEPFNHTRKIVGFDTFKGFPKIVSKDGNSDDAFPGSYSVTDKYEEYLKQAILGA